jgi:hypothetical protein
VGDEQQPLAAGRLPPAHLVTACGTRADHVAGVGVFQRARGRLHDANARRPWHVAGAAKVT